MPSSKRQCATPRSSRFARLGGGTAWAVVVLALIGSGCSKQRAADAQVSDGALLHFRDGSSAAPRDAAAKARRDSNLSGDATAPRDATHADAAPPEPVDSLGRPTNLRDAVPIVLSADARGISLLGFAQTAQDDDLKSAVFTAAGETNLLSSVLVAVDPAKRYRLSGRFRSSGSEPSKLYLGVAPYSAEPRFIRVEQAERVGAAATLTGITATELSTAATLTGWSKGGPAYARQLGFYFDGEIDHLPDAIWGNQPAGLTEPYSTDPALGAFSTAENQTVALNAALPATISGRVVNGTTRVMNHSGGGTYLYAAAALVTVPNTWTLYQGELTGAAFNGGPNVFRPTTAYVRLAILLNYRQGDAARLSFTDLSLVEVD
ncbi:MAG: hypothetical protein IPL40_02415 [Proteobacteria bacterium]|nr:hypothetical protein [Pseudomonadota bacterium]